MASVTAQNSADFDPAYPHSGSFSLSDSRPKHPTFNENVYLLMKGFNAIKVKGPVVNAKVMLIWNLDRTYGTELWTDLEDNVDDVLIFPFKDNSGTISFEGVPQEEGKPWEAKLNFEFVNLTEHEIEELTSDDSS
jgi:hypothetical protein